MAVLLDGAQHSTAAMAARRLPSRTGSPKPPLSQMAGPAAARRPEGQSIANAQAAALNRLGAVPLLVLVALAMLIPGFTSLPPMDRDEPRFAQASKQMLETSDFVAIRFGDEARNKKPVGIHWLQAATVRTAEAVGLPEAARRIWVYRLPSLLGAVLTVLLTAWAALPLVGRSQAVLAGALVAATPLLGVEARLATTDAVLAATVTAAMGALLRLYLADAATRARSLSSLLRINPRKAAHPSHEKRQDFVGEPTKSCLAPALVFWFSVGVGILIKGPITPLIPALAVLVLAVKDRSAGWLRALRPLPGLVLCLAIVLPWFVLILLKTHGAFFAEAVGHDLLGKVGGAQESHGAPPGFYFAAFWLTAWPLAPFAALGAPFAWRNRHDPPVAFLLAWALPFWLVLEAVPTKLVHYALPLYPALAILAVLALARTAAVARSYRPAATWAVFALLALLPVAVAGLVVAGQGRFWSLDPLQGTAAALALLLALGLAWQAREALLGRRALSAGLLAAGAGVPVYLFAYGVLLTPGTAGSLAVSPRLAAQAEAALGDACPVPLYATIGNREPSLMFATNTRLLMTDPAGAAQFMEDGPCRVAFVGAGEEGRFKAALRSAEGIRLASRVQGVAINGGRNLDIGVYIRQ